MYPASSEGLNKETGEAVYFFTPAFHPLDNFSAHSIFLWGVQFPTAEHAFQWKKFSEARPDIAEKILAAKSPHAVKEISDATFGELVRIKMEKIWLGKFGKKSEIPINKEFTARYKTTSGWQVQSFSCR